MTKTKDRGIQVSECLVNEEHDSTIIDQDVFKNVYGMSIYGITDIHRRSVVGMGHKERQCGIFNTTFPVNTNLPMKHISQELPKLQKVVDQTVNEPLAVRWSKMLTFFETATSVVTNYFINLICAHLSEISMAPTFHSQAGIAFENVDELTELVEGTCFDDDPVIPAYAEDPTCVDYLQTAMNTIISRLANVRIMSLDNEDDILAMASTLSVTDMHDVFGTHVPNIASPHIPVETRRKHLEKFKTRFDNKVVLAIPATVGWSTICDIRVIKLLGIERIDQIGITSSNPISPCLDISQTHWATLVGEWITAPGDYINFVMYWNNVTVVLTILNNVKGNLCIKKSHSIHAR